MRALRSLTLAIGCIGAGALAACQAGPSDGRITRTRIRPIHPILPMPPLHIRRHRRAPGQAPSARSRATATPPSRARASRRWRRASTGRWISQFAPDGRAYILDWQNHRVRRIDADGTPAHGVRHRRDRRRADPGHRRRDHAARRARDVDQPQSPDRPPVLARRRHADPRRLAQPQDSRRWTWRTNLADIVCGRGPGFAGDGGPDAVALHEPAEEHRARALGRSLRARRAQLPRPPDRRRHRHHRDRGRRSACAAPAATGATRWRRSSRSRPTATTPSRAARSRSTARGASTSPTPRTTASAASTSRAALIETVAGDGTAGNAGDGGPATLGPALPPARHRARPRRAPVHRRHREPPVLRAVDLATRRHRHVAGTGAAGASGDGGPARAATLHRPFGIALRRRGRSLHRRHAQQRGAEGGAAMTAPLWLRRPALGLLLSVATAAAPGCGDDLGARPPGRRSAADRPADPTTMTGALCASGQICTIAGTGHRRRRRGRPARARDAALPPAGHHRRSRRPALRRRLEQPPHPRDRQPTARMHIVAGIGELGAVGRRSFDAIA